MYENKRLKISNPKEYIYTKEIKDILIKTNSFIFMKVIMVGRGIIIFSESIVFWIG